MSCVYSIIIMINVLWVFSHARSWLLSVRHVMWSSPWNTIHWSLSWRTNTQAHTHTQACTHTHRHTHTHTLRHAYTHTLTLTCTHTHTHTEAHMCVTHTHTHTQAHAHTHTHTHRHVHTCTHTQRYTHTLACTHIHTGTHACTHARTHARTHTHTHKGAREGQPGAHSSSLPCHPGGRQPWTTAWQSPGSHTPPHTSAPSSTSCPACAGTLQPERQNRKWSMQMQLSNSIQIRHVWQVIYWFQKHPNDCRRIKTN